MNVAKPKYEMEVSLSQLTPLSIVTPIPLKSTLMLPLTAEALVQDFDLAAVLTGL
jgi:hypothetical protein